MSLLEKSKAECLNKAQKNTNCIKEKNNKLDYFNLRKSVHQTL